VSPIVHDVGKTKHDGRKKKIPTMTDRIYGIEKKKYVIAAARSPLECNDSDFLLSSHITNSASIWNYRDYYEIS
jgi:hypothetical protein